MDLENTRKMKNWEKQPWWAPRFDRDQSWHWRSFRSSFLSSLLFNLSSLYPSGQKVVVLRGLCVQPTSPTLDRVMMRGTSVTFHGELTRRNATASFQQIKARLGSEMFQRSCLLREADTDSAVGRIVLNTWGGSGWGFSGLCQHRIHRGNPVILTCLFKGQLMQSRCSTRQTHRGMLRAWNDSSSWLPCGNAPTNLVASKWQCFSKLPYGSLPHSVCISASVDFVGVCPCIHYLRQAHVI